MKSTASEIAATILGLCNERGKAISNLKLQKLLYYCEAWHLAIDDESLFLDPIEAWVHGPVVAEVFRTYKDAGWSPIRNAKTLPSDDSDVKDHVSQVLDSYADLAATELERLTHREKPWLEARRGFLPDEPSRSKISRKTMKDFYSSLIA